MLFLNISGVPGHMSLTNQIMPMYNKCNVNENVNVKIILYDNADVRLFTCQWEGRGWQGTCILYIDRQTYGHCYSYTQLAKTLSETLKATQFEELFLLLSGLLIYVPKQFPVKSIYFFYFFYFFLIFLMRLIISMDDILRISLN